MAEICETEYILLGFFLQNQDNVFQSYSKIAFPAYVSRKDVKIKYINYNSLITKSKPQK